MTMLRALPFLLALLDTRVLGFSLLPGEQRYQVVYPRKIHTQHKRDTESKYPDLVHYGLELNGEPIELQLERTEDLLTDNYTETRYLDNGTPVTTSPAWRDHCHYQGRVKNDDNSQVSLSLCHGLSGFIKTQEQQLLIEPLSQTESGAHAVYPYQAQETPKTCGVDHSMYNDSIMTKTSFSISNAQKIAFLRARKFIRLYIVADNSMFIKYNRNKKELQERVYGIVNFVNLVYKPLNIFVALTGLEIWDRGDQFEVVTSANANLDNFSKWRKDYLLSRKPNDNAQFLTHTDFDGATVGLAWIGTLCSDTHSTGVIQDHSKEYIPVGATIAHEMGHNLGMNHDSNSCICSSESCIMAPSLSYNTPREFSSCSQQNYQDFLLNNMPLCMMDAPNKNDIESPAVCGNKFTESGEECDCGTERECSDKCCDAKTCKLKKGAQCSEGGCCSNCQVKSAGSVCRDAKDDCDLAEMCDGKSPVCPSNRFRMNGFPCRNGEGFCHNGKCPTHLSQCQMYWGQDWIAGSDFCFSKNQRGGNGFCRQNRVNVVCPARDVKCGVLFCSRGKEMDCNFRTPTVMVEDGTRCAEESVCQGGRCTDIHTAYQSRDCSTKCPKNSVCDHELKCQCEEGWAPPDCATRAQFSTGYIVIIVILLLVVIFAVSLVLYKRSQRKQRAAGRNSGVANPTFNIEDQGRRKPIAPSSTPQVNPMQPPRPPHPAHKPPFQSAYRGPGNVLPSQPTYPTPPPQAMKPNYRR
ncbi:zinc metalloproteinase-disintegrin-like VAP1 [Pyxicephalus adspersus]|uniref:zinc metalloproteinase-disintegrin-like VAP1 n=1 Tax=Pyxicephalus adspersus TaxID=30357 RepID=UPI003B5A1A45